MVCIYLQAPFAAYRNFVAGSYRSTAGFLTYSAAYGLVLNVAGIEMREVEGNWPMTTIKEKLPLFRMALAALSFPAEHTIYQQLHNYPVGNSGQEHAPNTKGNKYNITPVRRAFLSDLRAYIVIDGDSELENRVGSGLDGMTARTYGIPFAGDNSFLLDRLETVSSRQPAYWLLPVSGEESGGLNGRIMRLTTYIDRADMSNTASLLCVPTRQPQLNIPEEAWVEVGY